MTQAQKLELSAQPPHPALLCSGLSGGYAGEQIISAFSFEFRSGRVYGLLGANGAGKSTLLRLLSAVLPAPAGSIGLDGRSLHSLGSRQRARLLAMVPQSAMPVEGLTVAEALGLARLPYSEQQDPQGSECIAAAAAALGLEQHLSQDCSRLSGGQWRRVLTAQGLAQLGPQGGVLLLDEPGAFLDPPARAQLFRRLQAEARERGRCVLVTLHDLPAAGEHCDELLLLKQGRLLASGSPEAMLQPELLAELYSEAVEAEKREVA